MTRIPVTNGSRVKLRKIMNEFQILRQKILSDYKNDLKRRYHTATGEEPSEEEISGGGGVQMFEGKGVVDLKNKERHEGEKMDDIEENVTNAGNFLSHEEEEEDMVFMGFCCDVREGNYLMSSD
ncbi:hypothetical protein NC651_013375 [Populus alba x Populus x berolinensis]|nr:hypothetical protein NC651_013375 [Populus alba x Populus x berolinensis]